jgi:hypothetical protein
MKIPDISEIIHAWKIAAKPTPQQQEIAEQRVMICDTCEFKEYKKIVHTYVCNACGCPLSKKVYSPKGPIACPKGKWNV